jgi:uncharacterized protein (TIGR03086 family)
VRALEVDSLAAKGDASEMEAIDALRIANGGFAARASEVGPGDWEASTPCPDWDVRALFNHVLLGTRMSVQLLDGMAREDVISHLDDDLMAGTTDPAAAFVELADEMVAGFAAPGGLEGTVAHPAGDFPRSMFIGFRVTDSAVHAWDLARAIGADATLDAEVVQWLWDEVQPQKEMLAATGMFGEGASGTLDETALLQDRYLDLMGRRP